VTLSVQAHVAGEAVQVGGASGNALALLANLAVVAVPIIPAGRMLGIATVAVTPVAAGVVAELVVAVVLVATIKAVIKTISMLDLISVFITSSSSSRWTIRFSSASPP
jgi:hypothetical protein